MAEETPVAAAQAAENAQQTSQAEGQSTTAASQADEGNDQSNLSQDQLLELNKKLLAEKRDANKEAQKMRADLKALQEAESKRQEADMSELDKAKKLATDAEARIGSIQARLVQAEVRSVAASLGFADASIASKLIDSSQLNLDDEGMPTNAKELLEGLLKDHPYLKGQTSGLPATQRAGSGAAGADRSEEDKAKEAAGHFPFLARKLAAKP